MKVNRYHRSNCSRVKYYAAVPLYKMFIFILASRFDMFYSQTKIDKLPLTCVKWNDHHIYLEQSWSANYPFVRIFFQNYKWEEILAI